MPSPGRLRIAVWLGCQIVVLAGIIAEAPAQDPLQNVLPPQGVPTRAKVLVLKTGQVMRGEIEARLGGYLVQTSAGNVVIPYDQARTAADSLEEAYQRLRKGMHSPTADDHMELARWCAQVGLIEPARQEILSVFQFEPQRTDARALLKQLESRQPGTPSVGSDETLPAMRFSGIAPPSAQSSSALSRERMGDYMRQIQPLMLNSCASVACHGGTDAGDFRLRVSARLHRHDSDANLESVLRFINTEAPELSLLLTATRQTTGPHATAFRGPKAREHWERLATWTRQVAAESAGSRKVTPVAGRTGSGGVVPAVGYSAGNSPVMPLPEANAAEGAALPNRRTEVDDSFLRKVLAEDQTDPFDPEEFNRRMHGRR